MDKWVEDTIRENARHIEIQNKEMGELRDCLKDFKRDNAVEHTKLFESLKNINIYITDIKKSQTRIGWGLFSGTAILVVSIIITKLLS